MAHGYYLLVARCHCILGTLAFLKISLSLPTRALLYVMDYSHLTLTMPLSFQEATEAQKWPLHVIFKFAKTELSSGSLASESTLLITALHSQKWNVY